jgi:hypothetical protein
MGATWGGISQKDFLKSICWLVLRRPILLPPAPKACSLRFSAQIPSDSLSSARSGQGTALVRQWSDRTGSRLRDQHAQHRVAPSLKSPTCVTTGALTYAAFMVTSSLKLFTGLALAAAIALSAYDGGGVLLSAAVLVLVCAGLFCLRSLSGSRFRTELLHDPAVSTLVFPPESKLQRPPR